MTMKILVEAIKKTEEIDESGDANFQNWLLTETDLTDDDFWLRSFDQIIVDFLIWANGPNWKEFLETAKVGDVPQRDR